MTTCPVVRSAARHSGAGPAFLFLAAILGLAVPSAAQGGGSSGPERAPLSLEQICPADVFAFVSFAGIDNCAKAAEGLGLYRLWQEPEVQAFVEGIVAKYKELAAGTPPPIQEHWDLAKRFLSGRVSVALSGMTQIWTPGRDSAPVPFPGVVLAVDLGERATEGRAMFEKLLGQFSQHMPGVEKSAGKIGNRESTVISLTSTRTPRCDLHCVFADNLFLVGLNDGLLGRCLANIGAGSETLGRNSAFARGRSKVDGTGLLEIFLSTQAITSRVRGWIPDEWIALLGDLGLTSMNGLYLASAVAPNGEGSETVYIDAPAPRTGLLNLGGEKPISAESLRMIPETAVFALGAKLPFADLVKTLLRAADNFLPARERKFIHDRIAQAEEMIGFKFQDEILAAFGDELVLFLELGKLTYFPNAVVSLEVRDQGRAEAIIGKVLEIAHLTTEEKAVDQHKCWTVKLPFEINLGVAEATPSITYAFAGNRLLLASNRLSLKPALARIGGDTTRAAVASENFKAATAGLPLDRAGYFHYVDVKRAASVGYGFAANLAGSFDVEQVPVDFSQLPSEETVLKHIQSWAAVGSSDADGIVFRSRSTLSLGMVLAAAGRIIHDAPGCPPFVIESFVAHSVRHEPAEDVRGPEGDVPGPARREEGRGSAGVGVGDGGRGASASSAPRSGSGPVNPLAENDPQNAEFKTRIGKLTERIASRPDDGDLRFQRANLHHRVREFAAAAADFEKARELGVEGATCPYNTACCYSLMGKADEAFRWLKVAFEEGMDNWSLVESDSDLDAIRSDPRYQELLKAYK